MNPALSGIDCNQIYALLGSAGPRCRADGLAMPGQTGFLQLSGDRMLSPY